MRVPSEDFDTVDELDRDGNDDADIIPLDENELLSDRDMPDVILACDVI